MMIRNAWLPSLLLLAVPSLLFGQAERERQSVRAKGALKAAAGGMLQVIGEDGAQWIVRVDPMSQYNVFQGSAEKRFLRPGMFVEFRNSFDKKGTSQLEVRELKIFSPRKDTRLGLTPASGGLASTGLFSDADEDDNKKKKSKQPEVLPFLVTGRIRSVKDNRMVVLAGPAQVSVALADKVQIAFSLSDFNHVNAGDTVEVSGWAYPEKPNHVVASRLTITAAKPLGSEDENAKKKPTKVPDLNSLDDF